MNHNFPDLNNIMWDAQDLATDRRRVSNHYIPMPEYYTSTDAMVRKRYACLVHYYDDDDDYWLHSCLVVQKELNQIKLIAFFFFFYKQRNVLFGQEFEHFQRFLFFYPITV